MEQTHAKQERRYRRTETLILNGLTTLLQEKSINEITVRELTDLVDINRSTFYLHYSDIYDLLEKTEQRLLNELTSVADTEWADEYSLTNFYNFLLKLYMVLAKNASLYSVLIGPHGDISFLHSIEDFFSEKSRETLRNYASKNFSESELEYVVTYQMSGCIGMTREWLQNGCPETPEQMTTLTMTLLREGFYP